MSRLISELPYEIKLKAMKYSNAPGEDDLAASFIWNTTDEGHDIWEGIYNKGDYQSFYSFHDINSTLRVLGYKNEICDKYT